MRPQQRLDTGKPPGIIPSVTQGRGSGERLNEAWAGWFPSPRRVFAKPLPRQRTPERLESARCKVSLAPGEGVTRKTLGSDRDRQTFTKRTHEPV